jgi:ComF family protein
MGGKHKTIDNIVNLLHSPLVYKSLVTVREIIYPSSCRLCDSLLSSHAETWLELCSACHSNLPWNTRPCHRCALPLPEQATIDICAQCLQQPPPFDDALAPLQYNPGVAWLVTQLKFHQQLGHARMLGRLLGQALMTRQSPLPDRIIPIPLHASRLRERGYNQALEIARPVAKQLSVPLDIHSVQRVRATPPQSQMDLKSRRRNIRGAFRCERSLHGQQVAILDDVVTSGATARELALQLKQAGAASVSLWATTRAPAPWT